MSILFYQIELSHLYLVSRFFLSRLSRCPSPILRHAVHRRRQPRLLSLSSFTSSLLPFISFISPSFLSISCISLALSISPAFALFSTALLGAAGLIFCPVQRTPPVSNSGSSPWLRLSTIYYSLPLLINSSLSHLFVLSIVLLLVYLSIDCCSCRLLDGDPVRSTSLAFPIPGSIATLLP